MEKKKAIQEIMHGDLFRLFAQIERQMTATEATLRQAEKVMQFSPTFSRLTSEYLDPKIRRIFSILWRQGKMPDPPEEIAQVNKDRSVMVPVPNVSYNNRIALAIKASQNTNYAEFIAMNESLVEMRPDILDNIDMDHQFRDNWRNAGLPEKSLMDEDERDEQRAVRAEQQAQAAQMEAAAQMASTAKDASAANGGQLPDAMLEAQDQAL
jgi:hypothetical protein